MRAGLACSHAIGKGLESGNFTGGAKIEKKDIDHRGRRQYTCEARSAF